MRKLSKASNFCNNNPLRDVLLINENNSLTADWNCLMSNSTVVPFMIDSKF